MNRSLLANLVLVCFICTSLALMIWIWAGAEIPVSHPVEKQKNTGSMGISGFGFSTYDGASLITRVQADLFRIVPRKFGIFRMKSVNEAMLVKARFEIYLGNATQSQSVGVAGEKQGQTDDPGVFSAFGDQVNSSAKALPGMQEVGNVTRLVMDGMELAFCREQSPYLEARARSGGMDFKKEKITMRDAVLEHFPSGKKIFSETIIWDDDARVFKIPGRYEAHTPKGRAKGRGITVDLDFHVDKIPVGNG